VETYFNCWPDVLQVLAGEGRTVYVYFSDGTVRRYDAEPLMGYGRIFSHLEGDDFFRKRLTVLNGTLAWDLTGTFDTTKCIDLDPIDVYDHSVVVPDPLETVEDQIQTRTSGGAASS